MVVPRTTPMIRNGVPSKILVSDSIRTDSGTLSTSLDNSFFNVWKSSGVLHQGKYSSTLFKISFIEPTSNFVTRESTKHSPTLPSPSNYNDITFQQGLSLSSRRKFERSLAREYSNYSREIRISIPRNLSRDAQNSLEPITSLSRSRESFIFEKKEKKKGKFSKIVEKTTMEQLETRQRDGTCATE